jgi:hypothetical protein
MPLRPTGCAGKGRRTRWTLAAALILGALVCAPRGVPADAAPAAPGTDPASSFTDATHTYSFRYPAGWTLRRARGFDVLVVAPDGNAAAGAVLAAAPAGATGIDVQATLGRYALQFGARAGAARYGSYRSWSGQTIGYGFVPTRRPGGTVGLALVAGTAAAGHAVTLYGVIGNVQAATWQRDSGQLGALMGSLALLPPPRPARPESASVAHAVRC